MIGDVYDEQQGRGPASSVTSASPGGGDNAGSSLCVDNSGTVLAKIANLYAERLMSDVCLVVGNVEYPSHRLILCASSDVFQVMLMNPNWSESQEKRIVLGETASCANCFEDFLRYFYTGKIQLNFATILPLVSLADKYNVHDLLKLGLDFMARNLSLAANKHQLVTWLQFFLDSGRSLFAEQATSFIKWNLEAISQTLDFASLELDPLLHLIQTSDLVIRDEVTLFQCVCRWLEGQRRDLISKGEENVDMLVNHYVVTLLPHIRFPMMTPSQLANLLLNPLSQSHTDLFVERIRVAMAYHKDMLDSNVTADKIFTPRLYTVEKFCASISVDHFHSLQQYHCRSLLFASQKYIAEGVDEQQFEWTVDVYPKGVWFKKCVTVYRPPGLELPEKVLKTVRVTISTHSVKEIRVRIGLLVVANQGGFEHVGKLVTRNYIFSENDQIVNFDDLIDYDDLNNVRSKSRFLSGPYFTSFKLHIVIVPLSKLSLLQL